jgi:hypothetical protein
MVLCISIFSNPNIKCFKLSKSGVYSISLKGLNLAFGILRNTMIINNFDEYFYGKN